jgi:hypothetical protein
MIPLSKSSARCAECNEEQAPITSRSTKRPQATTMHQTAFDHMHTSNAFDSKHGNRVSRQLKSSPSISVQVCEKKRQRPRIAANAAQMHLIAPHAGYWSGCPAEQCAVEHYYILRFAGWLGRPENPTPAYGLGSVSYDFPGLRIRAVVTSCAIHGEYTGQDHPCYPRIASPRGPATNVH